MAEYLIERVKRKLRRISEEQYEKQYKKFELFYQNWNIGKSAISFIHREKQLAGKAGRSDGVIYANQDEDLVRRIISAYQLTNNNDLGESMWKAFFVSHHSSIHKVLMAGDVESAAEIFRDPKKSDLFYGFDILTKSFIGMFDFARTRNSYARVCLDGLVRFAEATGAIAMDNPETWLAKSGKQWNAECLLAQISEKCWSFSVPNPYPDEHGLETSRGVLSYRVPQALYQAWRVKQLVKGKKNPRILEIGAGLGRTAYYANELGLKDYSIVDIPITAACQAYFLGRTLGDENIYLDGESLDDSSPKIKIISPQTFMNEEKKYDLILNADSLTEMDISTAKSYWEKIKNSTNIFLSINHEINTFSVKDLIADDLHSYEVTRFPSWMRKGYVEELITKKPLRKLM